MGPWRVETWKLVDSEWVVPPTGLWVGAYRREALEYARKVRLDGQTAVTVNRYGRGCVRPVAGQLRALPDA
jgi:hypothetical protein